MCTSNQLQVIDMTEICCDLGTKDPSCTTSVDSPILNILRVTPHQVAEWTFVGNLNAPIDGSNLIDSLDLWAESAMDTHDLSVDDSTQR